MMARAYIAGLALLMGLLSFVIAASTGAPLTLAWSLVAGGLAFLFVRMLTEATDMWSGLEAMAVAGASVAMGGALKWLTGSPTTGSHDAIGILVAMGAAWGLDASVSRGRATPCFVCKESLEGVGGFSCPRCKQSICARPSCWIGRRFRCRYCDERDVVLFPNDERWWRSQVGARVTDGSCSNCYKEAHEADLRACGRCQWTWCRRCWDHQNGQCGHCDWIIPDLPAALRPFYAGQHGAGARHAESRRQR